MELAPGYIIDGKVEVKALIGQGGMGTVYRVRHWDWNLDLALKIPLEHLVSDRVNKERFILEAHTWIDLGVHPNIVQCWFVSEWQGRPLLFLDYLPHGNLKDWVKAGGVQAGDWETILDLLIQACDGLAHAHEHGLVHRDVKPANLLMREHNRLCVTDFGLVKVTHFEPLPGNEEEAIPEVPADLEPGASLGLSREGQSLTLTGTGSLLGTPEYGAPEQWTQARTVGVGADIYALGGILYELSCGRRPFDDGRKRVLPALLVGRHLSKPPPDPREFRSDVPPALCELILRCLAKRPEDRPPGMRALREELERIHRNLLGRAYPRAIPRPGVQRADALNNKAVSLWNLGIGQEAFDAWREASKLDALHPETGYNRAVLQWRLGQVDQGEVVRRLTQVKAAYPHAAAYLGYFDLERLCPQEAARELELAVRSSQDGIVWRALGDARMYLEQFEDATQAYRKALEYMPDDGETRSRLEMALTGVRVQEGRLRFPLSQPRLALERPGPVSALALTPDAEQVLTATEDRLEMWERASGAPLWSWRREFDDGGSASIFQLGLTAEFAVSLATPKGRVWSLETGQVLGELPGRKRFYALLPDGRAAVAGLEELEVQPLPRGEGLALLGHAKPVNAVAATQDRALSGGADRTVRWWDLDSGQCLRVLEGHSDVVEAVALSPDGAYGFSGGRDRCVRMWELASGECLRTFGEQPDTIRRLSLSPDARHLLVSCGSKERPEHLEVWDVSSGTRLFSKPGMLLAQVPGGPWLLTGTPGEGLLKLRESTTGRLLRTFEGHAAPATCAAVAADGRWAVSGAEDGGLRVWEVDEGSRFAAPPLVVTRSSSHTEAEDTRELFRRHLDLAHKHLSQGEPGAAWRHLAQAREVPGYVRDPEALALGSSLLAVLPRKSLRAVWSLRVCASDAPLTAVALTSDGALAISSSGRLLHLWELASGSCVRGFAGHSEPVRALALAPGGSQVLSGSQDQTLRLWDLSNGECLRVLKAGEPVIGLALAREGCLALAATPEQLQVWDLVAGEPVRTLEAPGCQMLALTPDGRLGLTGPELRLWEVFRGSERAFPGQASPEVRTATALALTRDGRHALTAGLDHTLRLWNTDDGSNLVRLSGHVDRVHQLALTSDGRVAFSASADGSVRIWDVVSGTCLHALEGHAGPVLGLAITGDGRFAVSVGDDQTLRSWELDWELNPEGQALPLAEALRKPGLLTRVSSLFWKRRPA